MEVLAYLQGCHICLPCSISSRKLLVYDPPSERPGKAASWTFGIISYFINGFNSHSWGQLEGLLDLIMLEREATRNILHGARETAGREQASSREMWWEVSHAAQAEGLKPCSTRETASLRQTASKGDSGPNSFPGRIWEDGFVHSTLMSAK